LDKGIYISLNYGQFGDWFAQNWLDGIFTHATAVVELAIHARCSLAIG